MKFLTFGIKWSRKAGNRCKSTLKDVLNWVVLRSNRGFRRAQKDEICTPWPKCPHDCRKSGRNGLDFLFSPVNCEFISINNNSASLFIIQPYIII